MKPETFTIERTFNAAVDKVWQAITDKEIMKQWYFDIADFKPEVGAEFSFSGTDHDGREWIHLCRVTEVVFQKKLAHTWRYEGVEGDTLVTWELFEKGEQTTVKLTHTGFETFPPLKSLAKESFAAGWTEIVGSLLKDFLEFDSLVFSEEISADPNTVWEALVTDSAIRKWAAAFAPGTYVETDWKIDSEVVWKDAAGNTCARGKVIAFERPTLLQVGFWDDLQAASTKPLDRYRETFRLETFNGKTMLHAAVGPIEKKHTDSFNSMWGKAMKLIRDLAEQRTPVS